MDQRKMDIQDQKLKNIKKALRRGIIAPDEAFDTVRMMGFGRMKSLEKINDFCKKTNFRSNFTLKELEEGLE